MKARTPEQVNELLIDALNRGDVDSALDLYEDDAQFVTADGIISGKAAIRTALEGFASLSPQLKMTPKPSVHHGDIALTGNNWSLTGTDGEGNAIKMSGSSYEVVRCDADGNWRFAIDNPDAE